MLNYKDKKLKRLKKNLLKKVEFYIKSRFKYKFNNNMYKYNKI